MGDKMQHTTNVSPFLPFLHYACVRACLRAREAETAAYIPRLGSAGCCESHVLLPAPLHTAPHHHHHHYPRGSRCVSQRTEADVSKPKKKKRNTHTISHVSTPLPKQKANDRVLQPLPFTTIRRYYLCHDRVGEGGGVRRVRPIIRRIRFGMVREHFFTDVASARWRSVGVPGRGGGAMAGSSSSSTAGYTSQQIS